MRTGYAWLTILAALGVGIVGGKIFDRYTLSNLTHNGVTCLVLREAELAGVLTPPKRAELLAKVAQSQNLQGKDRDIAAMLTNGCANLLGKAK